MTGSKHHFATVNSLAQSGLKNYMKSLPLFSGLNDDLVARFSDKAIPFEMASGQSLFFQRDPVTNFYIILSGWVKLYRTTQDGNEAVFDILTSHQLCGETSIFDGKEHGFSATVIEDTTGFKIPTKILNTALREDNKMAYAMLKTLSRYRREQSREIESLTQQNASQRIGCYLLRLCQEFPTEPVVVRLPYDKSMIAARLGMRPETFSRALNKLREQTDVEIEGGIVTVPDKNSLKAYSCFGCSSEYPCLGQ